MHAFDDIWTHGNCMLLPAAAALTIPPTQHGDGQTSSCMSRRRGRERAASEIFRFDSDAAVRPTNTVPQTSALSSLPPFARLSSASYSLAT